MGVMFRCTYTVPLAMQHFETKSKQNKMTHFKAMGFTVEVLSLTHSPGQYDIRASASFIIKWWIGPC